MIYKPLSLFLVLLLVLIGVRYLRPKVEPVRRPMPSTPVAIDQKLVEIVAGVNKHNGVIRTLTCQDVQIKLADRFLGRFNAQVYFERPRRLRLIVSSLLGVELDIGSNDDVFWFWSKRMQPPGLYYSTYEHLAETRLKTPFHPVWMIAAMGVDEVRLDGATASRDGELYQLRREAFGPSGQPVTRITVIDPKIQMIVAEHILEDGKLVASSEIRSHHRFAGSDWLVFPATIVMHWYEENVTLEWTLERVSINSSISPDRWQLPAIGPRFDMAKD